MSKKSLFICSICDSRNYTFKLTENREESLKLNKYCPVCKKATSHNESR